MSPSTATAGVGAPTPVRRRELAGVSNLRDIGGYPAGEGISRWGTLFRSDALHRLDDAGRAALGEFGIAHIVDLRGGAERAEAPSALAGLGVTVHHVPVFDDADPAVMATTHVRLDSVYDHMVDDRGGQLAAAVRIIADAAPGAAVLVHCTAGKDRTGLVVAFALCAAGIDRAAVVEDYAATAANLRGAWADEMLAGLADRGFAPTPEVVALVTASPADLLERLLDRIDAEHGSMDAYLRAQGLTDDELARLRAALVSDDDDDNDDSEQERNHA